MARFLGYTEGKGKELFAVIAMEALAPKGIFEEEDIPVYVPRPRRRVRHYDDWTRNWEECQPGASRAARRPAPRPALQGA